MNLLTGASLLAVAKSIYYNKISFKIGIDILHPSLSKVTLCNFSK